MVLEPAYTGEGKQFFSTQDIIEASEVIPFLRIWKLNIKAM